MYGGVQARVRHASPQNGAGAEEVGWLRQELFCEAKVGDEGRRP